MKTQLRIGSDSKKFQSTSFKRAYLLVQIIPNLPGTSTDTNIDLTKLRTSIDLKQANVQDSTSFDAVAPTVLGCLQSKNSTALADINLNVSGLTCEGQSTSVNDLFTLEIPLLWGGYILKGDDCVTFNVDIINGFFDANCDNASSVYLVLEPDSDVTQMDINLPIYYPITSDKNSPSINEKAISELYLLNSSAYTFATQPYQSCELRSQWVNDRFDSVTLEARRIKETNQIGFHGNNVIYNVEPSALTDVEINLGINTANVTTGANYVFCSRVLTSAPMVRRAVAHSKKVIQRKAYKRGLSVN